VLQISTALTRKIRLILFLSPLTFRCRAGTWGCAICLSRDCWCDLSRIKLASCGQQPELALGKAGHGFQSSSCSHGPAGRPIWTDHARPSLNRPQAGGYSRFAVATL